MRTCETWPSDGRVCLSLRPSSALRVSDSPKLEQQTSMDGLQSVGPQANGIGMGTRAFQEMFKEAMEGGCVEVRGESSVSSPEWPGCCLSSRRSWV